MRLRPFDWVAVHQRTAVIGRKKPFMRIYNKTIGMLYTFESHACFRIAKRGKAVRPIYMQPNVMLCREICKTFQIIDGAAIGCTCIPDDSEDTTYHGGACHGTGHGPACICINHNQFGIHHACHGSDTAVGLAAAQDPPAIRALFCPCSTCGMKRRQIPQCAA